jgi:hypothetical protein
VNGATPAPRKRPFGNIGRPPGQLAGRRGSSPAAAGRRGRQARDGCSASGRRGNSSIPTAVAQLSIYNDGLERLEPLLDFACVADGR